MTSPSINRIQTIVADEGSGIEKWLETGGLAKRFAGFRYFGVHLSKMQGSPTSKYRIFNNIVLPIASFLGYKQA
jgi:hypothetical protein